MTAEVHTTERVKNIGYITVACPTCKATLRALLVTRSPAKWTRRCRCGLNWRIGLDSIETSWPHTRGQLVWTPSDL